MIPLLQICAVFNDRNNIGQTSECDRFDHRSKFYVVWIGTCLEQQLDASKRPMRDSTRTLDSP